MAYGKDDRFQGTHDGNLSSILSQIRDYGPAVLGPAAEPLEPPASSRADRSAPAGRSGPETTPTPPPEPAARGLGRLTSITLSVLAATLVTGGIIAALYRLPTKTDLRPETAPNSDPVIREDIAALQTAISKLAERLEAIAAADKAAGQTPALGEPLDVSGWIQLNTRRPPSQESALGERSDATIGQTAGPERPGPEAEGLAVKLDALGQRLDSMTEQVVRLTSQTERSLAQVLTAPESPGPQRLAPTLAQPNTAAASPVAPELTGASAPASTAGQPATRPPAPTLSAEARIPTTGASPYPGAVGAATTAEVTAQPVHPVAQVATAESVGARGNTQVIGPVEDAASHRPAPTSSPPEAEQKQSQQLTALLGEDITIHRDALTGPSAREGQIVAAPDPLAPLLAAQKKALGKPETPTAPGVHDAAAVASAVPDTSSPNAPPAVAEGEWFINLAAVPRSTALELQRIYRDKGVDVQVVSLGRRGLFGVRVGGFNSRREASDRAPAIKQALGIRDVWIARQ